MLFRSARRLAGIAAIGNTIYVTWMNIAQPTFPVVLSHVAMVVSTTGGKSWSPTIPLGASYLNTANPNVLVTSSGRLFVAYDSGTVFTSGGQPLATSVVVATSTANGTVFATRTVMSGVSITSTYGPFYEQIGRAHV